jgi:hypothetical protein
MSITNKIIFFNVMIWTEFEDIITTTNVSKQLEDMVKIIFDENIFFKIKVEMIYNVSLSNRNIDWSYVYTSFFINSRFYSHLSVEEAMCLDNPELIEILIELFPNNKNLKQYLFHSCCNKENIDKLNQLIDCADINVNEYCFYWIDYSISKRRAKTTKKLLTNDKLSSKYRTVYDNIMRNIESDI